MLIRIAEQVGDMSTAATLMFTGGCYLFLTICMMISTIGEKKAENFKVVNIIVYSLSAIAIISGSTSAIDIFFTAGMPIR